MSAPLARRLRRAAVRHERRCRDASGSAAADLRLSLRELVQLHGDASVSVLLMVMALLTVVPVVGAGTVLSLGLFVLAWAWARGRDRVELPERLGAITLSGPWTRRTLHGLAWAYARADRWLRPRWGIWRHERTRALWGAWIALMAAVIFLPLPLGNVLPSLSLSLLGLGWLFRDGIALVGATVVGAAALVYTAAFGHIAAALVLRGWALVAG